MEAPARLPYNTIEQAVLARGLDDFVSLGPTEMLFFLCDALSSDPDLVADDLVAPFMYYYERAVSEARARSAEQREAAASIGIPAMDGPGGNLVAFAVFMFLAQTDFASTIGDQMDAWATANGMNDPRASNQGLASALTGVLDLEQPLPTPDAGESLDAYYERAVPAAVVEYLFRLDGRNDTQGAPWPYYRLVIGDGGASDILDRWWWLDPLAYFSLPQGADNMPADLVADAISRMVVGLLPIAGDTVDAQVANWQRDYDPPAYPWTAAPALGSASDPCARARGDLNAVGLSTIVVGPNQAATAEARWPLRWPPPLPLLVRRRHDHNRNYNRPRHRSSSRRTAHRLQALACLRRRRRPCPPCVRPSSNNSRPRAHAPCRSSDVVKMLSTPAPWPPPPGLRKRPPNTRLRPTLPRRRWPA